MIMRNLSLDTTHNHAYFVCMPRPTSPRINGAAVKAFRLKDSLTQAQLAEKATLSPQYLADIERGYRNASADIARRIASALEVPLEAVVPDVMAA